MAQNICFRLSDKLQFSIDKQKQQVKQEAQQQDFEMQERTEDEYVSAVVCQKASKVKIGVHFLSDFEASHEKVAC